MEKYFEKFLKDNKENFQLGRIGNIFYHAYRQGFDRQDYEFLIKIFSDMNIDTASARDTIFINSLSGLLDGISYDIGDTRITFDRLFDYIRVTKNVGLTDEQVRDIVIQMDGKLNYTIDNGVITLKE